MLSKRASLDPGWNEAQQQEAENMAKLAHRSKLACIVICIAMCIAMHSECTHLHAPCDLIHSHAHAPSLPCTLPLSVHLASRSHPWQSRTHVFPTPRLPYTSSHKSGEAKSGRRHVCLCRRLVSVSPAPLMSRVSVHLCLVCLSCKQATMFAVSSAVCRLVGSRPPSLKRCETKTKELGAQGARDRQGARGIGVQGA